MFVYLRSSQGIERSMTDVCVFEIQPENRKVHVRCLCVWTDVKLLVPSDTYPNGRTQCRISARSGLRFRGD